jgi:pimeloyl-ACP methyl ester carboxylesterase
MPMNYILIHGSWHGAWAFSKFTPFLTEKGHTVQCFDLPGSGEDVHNATTVKFDDLMVAVSKAIMNAESPSVVVAHSFAGFVVARVCEELHEKVHHIYHVAAWLPSEGKSLLDLAIGYNNSDFPQAFMDCGDERLKALNIAKAAEFFYHDCSAEDRLWAALRLRPKAAQLDLEKMPRVDLTKTLAKSTYIVCENDRVVNPISQRDMAKRFGFRDEQIKTIATGHSPFLAKPAELSTMLT